MTLTLLDTSRTDSRFLALCGLPRKALGRLLETAVPVLLKRRREAQERRPRKRVMGAGRKRTLTSEQEILLTLIYLRHNVAHEVVGELFRVSADTSENTFHEVVGVLREVCPSGRFDAEKKWKKGEPCWQPDQETCILVDTFDTLVSRPSTEAAQRRVYSGKHKAHTLKTQIITDGEGAILEVDPGHRGPTADKTLWEQSGAAARYPKAEAFADKAYQGAVGMRLPHKKPRGGELTEEQREKNRAHSRVRVRVEHSIRRVKAFRIMRAQYRLALGLFPRVAGAVVGLVQLTRLVT